MRALFLGLAGSFFFASTFILNRSMELEGGNWAWSASLRYLFTLPVLLLMVWYKKELGQCLAHLREHLAAYLLWSTIGFGVFYAAVCFAGAYGEGWLVAGTWEVTIIAGPLLTPFLLRKNPGAPNAPKVPLSRQIPFRAMRWSLLILAGIFLLQWEHARAISVSQALFCVVPLVIGAFAYPLGNRNMMAICGDEVDTIQRVLNMTIASLPFWLLLSLWAWQAHGLPGAGQITQSALVALLAGVLGTVLFFAATNLVKHNPLRLAAVEATQAGETVFALLGEIVLLSAPLPAAVSLAGICLIIAGIILHSLRGR